MGGVVVGGEDYVFCETELVSRLLESKVVEAERLGPELKTGAGVAVERSGAGWECRQAAQRTQGWLRRLTKWLLGKDCPQEEQD